MNEYIRTDSIVISIRFAYGSQGKSKSRPNDFRRVLMGVKSDKTIINLPQEVNTKIGSEIILPYQFSLIKDPQSIVLPSGKKRTINAAVGAIVIYKYLGGSNEIQSVVELIHSKLIETKNRSKITFNWDGVEVITGKVVLS